MQITIFPDSLLLETKYQKLNQKSFYRYIFSVIFHIHVSGLLDVQRNSACVDVGQANRPVAELESNKDHGDSGPGEPGAPHQLGAASVGLLVQILSGLDLNLGKRRG